MRMPSEFWMQESNHFSGRMFFVWNRYMRVGFRFLYVSQIFCKSAIFASMINDKTQMEMKQVNEKTAFAALHF